MHKTPPMPDWHPDFAQRSPLFEPLRGISMSAGTPTFARFAQGWPNLEHYQQMLASLPEPILTHGGQPLKIVAQDSRPQRFEEHYAPRIHMTGELQTRRENWHDFFQFLTWLIFPKTKATINALHVPHAQARLAGGVDPGRRTPLENMLSLFDEGGAVVLASDASLLQLIRAFRWKTLFWERRAELAHSLRCITFGHAVYEKALRPYVGMTANAVLLEVEPELLAEPMKRLLPRLDERLATVFARGDTYAQPQDLQPFPILGMPGWDPANADAAYYDDTRYFRPGRTRGPV
ncbi:MAG: DUF3025 domain-containing protein [Gammaproteobacteria bacterium]|nr:DUF3025 domain-containing protein [Gammaproteobacteria bacterium]